MAAKNQQRADELALLAQTSPNEFIVEFVKDLEVVDGDDYGYRGIAGLVDYELADNASVHGIALKTVESEGGGEGGGDSVTRVYEVLKNVTPGKKRGFEGGETICFLRSCGYYSSEEGTEWDNDFDRVYPRQVVVTQYFDSPEAA